MLATIVGMALWIGGCYDDPEPEPGPNGAYYDVVIDRSGPTGFEARVPWTSFDDPELFGLQIPSLQALAGRLGLQLRFVAGNSMAEDLADSFGDVGVSTADLEAPPPDEGVGLAREELRIPLRDGYYFSMDDYPVLASVGGCIARRTQKMSFRLNRYSDQVFDIHVAAWRDPSSGRICVGVYESVSGWSVCLCDPSRDVTLLMHEAMVAVGVAAGTAWTLARMAAPHLRAVLLVL